MNKIKSFFNKCVLSYNLKLGIDDDFYRDSDEDKDYDIYIDFDLKLFFLKLVHIKEIGEFKNEGRIITFLDGKITLWRFLVVHFLSLFLVNLAYKLVGYSLSEFSTALLYSIVFLAIMLKDIFTNMINNLINTKSSENI